MATRIEKLMQRAEDARELICSYLNIPADTPLADVLEAIDGNPDSDIDGMKYFVAEMLAIIANENEVDEGGSEDDSCSDEHHDDKVHEPSNN